MDQLSVHHPIFIAGPTASGKSAYAIKIVQKLAKNGILAEIINADSMQIYKELQIITARPTINDMQGIPHHLYGHVDGGTHYSAGLWSKEAINIIDDIQHRGRQPIIVGGTGMYFQVLEQGMSPIPDVDQQYRDQGNALFHEIGGEAFREAVMAFDPVMARLKAGDRQRLVRAYEIYHGTGKTLSHFQNLPRLPLLNETHGEIEKYVLMPQRTQLYKRINTRFDKMIELGALEEVRVLMNMGLPENASVTKSLGVPEFMAHLRGELPLNDAIDTAKMMTRRFAKRQTTWMRSMCDEKWHVIS